MNQEPQKNNAAIIVTIITVIGAIIAASINAMGNYKVEKIRQEAELTRIALLSSTTQGGVTQTVSQNIANASTNTPYPTSIPEINTPVPSSNDTRDIAAQTLGYANLDGLMSAFGIPAEIKTRIFSCPNEKTWCIGVYEEPGQADFHFKNVTNCTLDGKQTNGTSTIPAGFDGTVKGFTLRPCSR